MQEIEHELKNSNIRENKEEEKKAIEAINENHKYFYRYAKSKAQIKTSIGPLKKTDASEDLVTDNAEKCDKLGEQCVSAYSVPLPNNL